MNKPIYETVIGLEVHVELSTATKIFCACPTTFGAPPNTQCCPVCLGLPGAMPVLNRRAVELIVKAGLAFDCEISALSRADRKQYFYPDLPKAYQISQGDAPFCKNGALEITSPERGNVRIGIERIHLEEDAGKLVHRGSETFIDCNRCGVPLIEIVSRPEIRSAGEAAAYLKALRAVLVTCGISDCRMQEGEMRCDVNLSVREVGSDYFGIRTEIKNINSFAFAEKAIRYEEARQIDLLSRGESILPETRRYDAQSGQTVRMRVKETADDYRYLNEPDLPPVYLEEAEVERLRASLPELPKARAARLSREWGIPNDDAAILVSDVALADYYEAVAASTAYPRIAVNLLLSDLLRHCTSEPFTSPVQSTRLGELATLLGEGSINSATAKKLLSRLLISDFPLRDTVEREGLGQIRAEEALLPIARQVIETLPRVVADYLGGKRAALQALLGNVMKQTGGRADPVLAEQLLLRLLSGMKKRED